MAITPSLRASTSEPSPVVKLLFLGTRGYIDARTRRHRMHASLLISRCGARVVVDCGEDWLTKIEQLRPSAIVLTHAHPDHAWGLRRGCPCPVYATAATWQRIDGFPIAARNRRVISCRRPAVIGGMEFVAYPVDHSLRAPAVGYRIGIDGRDIFYAPDLIAIPARRRALRHVQLYIGDGASLVRPIVRRRGRALIGHASIRTQIEWCAQERIPRAIFTHCGSAIVGADARDVAATVRGMGEACGVDVSVARDAMAIVLRPRARSGARAPSR